MTLRMAGKTITDPLYGNIKLTRLESELVSTPAFQRLHNVKQLGLGHLVFPSAGYSRFAHSIGACGNADNIVTAIQHNTSKKISDQKRQAFRIAALMHDLGHYPFSHTTEHAVRKFYGAGSYKSSSTQLELPEMPAESVSLLDHEEVGKLVLEENASIRECFAKHGDLSLDDVRLAFLDEKMSTIISSDLDCDRMDYLRRTAHHSGAPYGAVDVDFLISKSTLDGKGRFCFDRKALRAADHLLMSRFYDFMQIPFHKTVASLEWSLEEAVYHLLENGHIALSESAIKTMSADGNWEQFDDAFLLGKMRVAALSSGTSIAKDHLKAVLERRPAKSVYYWECLAEMNSREHGVRKKAIERELSHICSDLSIDRQRFHIWEAPFKLAKAGPILQRKPSSEMDRSDEEEQQLIQILQKGSSDAVPLISLPNTISHHMAQLNYQVLRVYYLPEEKDESGMTEKVRMRLSEVG